MSQINPPRVVFQGGGKPRIKIPERAPALLPGYGDLDLPAGDLRLGSNEGMTLDLAIETLVRQNLSLLALQYEIPMAEADVLTAGLRTNPIFYADAQLVPYGQYTRENSGGQTQYDVNITHPLDLSRKRQARTNVARAARRTIEAQFQDAVRQQIDNLYTLFVDVAASELTLSFSRSFLEGTTRLRDINLELLRKGQISEPTVDALTAQVDQSRVQVREAEQALSRTTRALAQILNVPRQDALALKIRTDLRNVDSLPQQEEELIETAMNSRPDLIAFRIGIERANAEYLLARRERLSDFYLLYQPYTFQNNAPFGLKSPTSWAIGLTAPLPIYNRNQGNIERAKLNVHQTQVELAALERQVADEVSEAVREFELSRMAVLDYERNVLPTARRVRDAAFQRWRGGTTSVIEYLDAQKDFNEHVRDFRDALVRHRRAMLDLNTAVGARVLP
jgi:cobalt-zinc-cadmium efflux system outer membrane protein